MLSDISKKITRGIRWASFEIFSLKLIGILSAVIISRLLTPDDFGLYGIANSIIVLAMILTFTGFEGAIIQKEDVDTSDLDSAWTLELFKYLILGGILYLIAPIIEQLLKINGTSNVLRLSCLSVSVLAFRNIGVVLYRKELNLDKLYYLNVLPKIISTFCTIFLAYTYRNVYALLYGYLIQNLLMVVFSYIVHPYRPKISFSLSRILDLFNFGKWVLLSSILNFVQRQGLNLFIGRYWDVTVLGYFNRSNTFTRGQFSQFQKLYSKLIFPVFSKLQNDEAALMRNFLLVIKHTSFFFGVLISLVYIYTDEFIFFILGIAWKPIIPYMKGLLLLTFLETISYPFNSFFSAIGKPKIITSATALRAILIIIFALPVSRSYDLDGLIIVLICSCLSSFIIYFFKNHKLFLGKKNKILFSLIPGLTIGSIIIITDIIYFGMINDLRLVLISLLINILVVLTSVIIMERYISLELHKFLNLIFRNNRLNKLFEVISK